MGSRSVAFVLMLTVQASAAFAQEAAAVVDVLKQALGADLPGSVRVTAAGSAYVPADAEGGLRQHRRIQRFTQELDLAAPRLTEEAVLVDTQSGAPQPERTAHIATPASPWTDQYALWTTPAGFVAGATSRTPRVFSETVFGRPYRVVAVTTTAGPEVRGYVNQDNVLERTRTEIEQPGRGTVRYEAIFLDWQDFGGLKYPSLIIQKENNELARILVVDAVDAANTAGPSKPAATVYP